MSNEYTLFDYDDRKSPFVVTNVTTEQAHTFAKEKELNGFFLASQHPEPGRKADLLTYKRAEDGLYLQWTLREWTFTHHLDLKWKPRDETGEAVRRRDAEGETPGA